MKFLKKLKLKKTWPFILGTILVELFCFFVLFLFDFAIDNVSYIDDVVGTIGGIDFTYRQVIVYTEFCISVFIICTFIKSLWCILFECALKRMRKDD